MLIPASAVVASSFAVLQIAVALALVVGRRPAPARSIAVGLFALNGLATAATAVVALQGPTGWGWAALVALDAPTGAALVLLAAVLARDESLDDAPWSRGAGWGLAAVGAVAVAAWTLMALGHADRHPAWDVVVKLPVFVGYGALVAVLARRLSRGGSPIALRESGLLLGAFGARAGEFALAYGRPAFEVAAATELTVDGVAAAGLLLVVAGSAVALAGTAVRARGALRGWALASLTALAGGALVGATWPSLPAGWVERYVLSVLTLVGVRPALVGLAFEPERTLRVTGLLGAGFGLLVAYKGLVAAVFGTPLLEVGALDVVPVGLLLSSLPAFLLFRRASPAPVTGGVPSEPPSVVAAAPAAPPASVTRAEALVAFLADCRAQGVASVGAEAIRAATGIAQNNLAGEIRRAERLLGTDGRGIEARVLGVRGRKQYALTSEGAAAAARVASEEPPAETP